MKTKKKTAILITGALVAVLTLGTATAALAAPSVDGSEPGVGIRMGEAVRDAGARLIDVIAKLTGLSTDEVADLRAEGSSVADIAESQGVATDAVVAEVLENREAILDAKVADGTIDEATAEAALDRMTDRIEDRVTSTETGPLGQGCGGACDGSGGGFGPGGGRGMGSGYGMRDGVCPNF